jgi:carbonic anhydrase
MVVSSRRPDTPQAALAELIAGNGRFVSGRPEHPNQDAEHRAVVAAGQAPFALVFGCSDSRLAAEIIFDRGLGDLFMVRTAGQVADPAVLASIDYGVGLLGVPLVVVLGHDSCGAIGAARAMLDGEPAPSGLDLSALLDQVVPSVREARELGITEEFGMSAVHVRRTTKTLADRYAALGTPTAVVGMCYRLAEGRVSVVTDLVTAAG